MDIWSATKPKVFMVKTLNRLCTVIDNVAYRPAVIKATGRLPRWWNCQLAHASMRLDERWGLKYWDSERAPAAPVGLCDACGRRSAVFVVGGRDEEFPEEGDDEEYLGSHPVHICGWCQLDSDRDIRTKADLEEALSDAAARSIGWRWRWRPMP